MNLRNTLRLCWVCRCPFHVARVHSIVENLGNVFIVMRLKSWKGKVSSASLFLQDLETLESLHAGA